jgi:hypothetical protein
MNFNLPEQPSYSELKKWMLENMDSMPKTLDSGYIYYLDVKGSVNIYIDAVERRIIELGAGVQKDAIARAKKANLKALYENLKVKENWNKPLRRLEDRFNNYK